MAVCNGIDPSFCFRLAGHFHRYENDLVTGPTVGKVGQPHCYRYSARFRRIRDEVLRLSRRVDLLFGYVDLHRRSWLWDLGARVDLPAHGCFAPDLCNLPYDFGKKMR